MSIRCVKGLGQFLPVFCVVHEGHLFKLPVIFNTVDGALSTAESIGCSTSTIIALMIYQRQATM